MFPTIGTKVMIERFRKEPSSGHARVLDQNGQLIFLDLPLSEIGGHILLFDPGEKISVVYQLHDGAIYSFETQVENNKLTVDNLPAIAILMPQKDKISKIQRRQFLRVPVRLDLAYLSLLKHEHLEVLRTGQGHTWDISGGGLAFYANVDYIMPGDLLTIKFYLPGESESNSPVKVKGEVVRLRESHETKLSIISLKFTEIHRSMEQRIIQYVFRRQIELKNKGVEYYR